MLKKPKLKLRNYTNRSIFDIVSEDGVMRVNDIYHIIERLFFLFESNNEEDLSKISNDLHPKNIFINNDGNIYLKYTDIPLNLREYYVPPEQNVFSGSIVYAYGMLMLFMATGNVKKSDLDIFIEDNIFRTLIERCIAFDPEDRYKSTAELLNGIKYAKGGFRKNRKAIYRSLMFLFIMGIVLYFYHKGVTLGELKGIDLGYENGYISGYKKGFIDSPGIGIEGSVLSSGNGNLLENINSMEGAFATFNENEIYYFYANNIYQMNSYTEDIQILVSDVKAYGLNYYDGYVYYSTDENIYRYSLKDKKSEVFLESTNGLLYIVDDVFYINDLFNTGYLYRINKNSKEFTQLNGMTEYKCLNIVDNKLYYIDINKNNSIYSCDLDGGNLKLINSNSFESFSINKNKIYAYAINYKDTNIDYSMSFLVSMDLEGGNIESFTNIPAENICVTDKGIYYISGNNRILKWMSSDGKTQYTISSFSTRGFNLVGRWIFYINENDNSLWRVNIDGSKNKKVTE